MQSIIEINPYQSSVWKQQFKQTDVYQSIKDNYDHVIFSYRELTLFRAALHYTVYELSRKFLQDYKILDAVPYYYFQYIMENDPNVIVDLGCGLNVFKDTWSNIIGIDSKYCPEPICKHAVEQHFDDDFVAEHQELCDALISINTIHFSEIDTITHRLIGVSQLLRPNARAFVSFNLETWLMYTPREKIHKMFGNWPELSDVIAYVNDQIIATNLDFVVVDWPILRIPEEGTIRDDINGNIRLVFNAPVERNEKTQSTLV
jgi:hypothetical protein